MSFSPRSLKNVSRQLPSLIQPYSIGDSGRTISISSGNLIPAAFRFPQPKDKEKSGQSFLLKGLALVFHALHHDCNDGRPLPAGEWSVWAFPVAFIPKTIQDPENKVFYFRPIHVPYSTCRAHCELLCSDRPDSLDYVVPGKDIRLKVRIQLSRQFRPTGLRLVVGPAPPGERV